VQQTEEAQDSILMDARARVQRGRWPPRRREEPRALAIAFGAEALEAQVVVTIGPNLPVILESRLPLVAAMTSLPHLFGVPFDHHADHCVLLRWKKCVPGVMRE
jgi:hypothetical protein